jgi:hypothetical protein
MARNEAHGKLVDRPCGAVRREKGQGDSMTSARRASAGTIG